MGDYHSYKVAAGGSNPSLRISGTKSKSVILHSKEAGKPASDSHNMTAEYRLVSC